jgi:hypothetical protein
MLVALKEVGCWTQFSIILLSDDVAPSTQRSDTCIQTEKQDLPVFQWRKDAYHTYDCWLWAEYAVNRFKWRMWQAALNISLQDGGDKILQPNNNFKLFIRKVELWQSKLKFRLFQWPRGIRRGSEAVRLLGLRIRIPPGVWMSLLWLLCVVTQEISAWGSSLVQRSPTECGVSKLVWSCSLGNETLAH